MLTVDEYFRDVSSLITKSVDPDLGFITAAALGGLVRRAFPGVSWKAFGKKSFSELLRELESRGQIRVLKTDKGALAVGLPETTRPSEEKTSERPRVERFNPLRKPVWDAFVLTVPRGRRFMHRNNGSVRLALEIAPTPADDWVEIEPISAEQQREWAQEFLKTPENRSLHLIESKLADQGWHAPSFARALGEVNDVAARNWNRYRSSKISAVVKDWLAANNLPVELAFQTSRLMHDASPDGSAVAATLSLSSETSEVRAKILAAVAMLPLEKLLEIPIPAGLMLAALSNAKSR